MQPALKDKTARTLDVEDVTVRYGAAVAVDGVSLSIEPGEVVALLGPSGCGKTTLLRVVAGLRPPGLRPRAGRRRADRSPAGQPAQHRHRLPELRPLPAHDRGGERGLRPARPRHARAEVAAKVNRFLETVQLGGFRDRLPRQLSGGQQQRVALARALAVEPSILLLDEPFAALDRNLRLDMQIEVKRLQRTLGLTTILVTHDQDEAMSVADRIAVMNKGKVEQFDSPVAIYDQPQTLFVNGFIGSSNLLGGKIAAIEDGIATVTLDAGAVLRLPAPSGLGRQARRAALGPARAAHPVGHSRSRAVAHRARPQPAARRPAGARGAHRRRHDAQDRRAAARRARRACRGSIAASRPTPARPCSRVPPEGDSPCSPATCSAAEACSPAPPRSAAPPSSPASPFAKGSLIATTYPGSWEDAYRAIVLPMLKKQADIDLELAPLFAMDQIGKVKASRGAPPFDAFLLDPGPRIVAIEGGLFDKFDPKKLTNLSKIPASFADEYGVCVSAQVVGIAYNPKKVPAPKGWTDLLIEPWVSRLGLTGFQTTFGTSSIIELSKQFGGSLTDPDPGLAELKKVLPKIAAVGLPAAMPGLFQQGQCDVMYTNTQTVATLKGKGVDIEFVKPERRRSPSTPRCTSPRARENVENAYKYLDLVIGKDVQAALTRPPYNFLPVNEDVPLLADLPMKSLDEMTKYVDHDWAKINPLRAAWIEKFNKDMAK